eukprot:Ihof_evm1s98 gene=Ihof_evmTU1s98
METSSHNFVIDEATTNRAYLQDCFEFVRSSHGRDGIFPIAESYRDLTLKYWDPDIRRALAPRGLLAEVQRASTIFRGYDQQ